jgi:hypothetical protein
MRIVRRVFGVRLGHLHKMAIDLKDLPRLNPIANSTTWCTVTNLWMKPNQANPLPVVRTSTAWWNATRSRPTGQPVLFSGTMPASLVTSMMPSPTRIACASRSCHLACGQACPSTFPLPPKVVIRTPQVSKASERAAYFIKKNRDDNFRHPCNLLLVVWQSLSRGAEL